MKALPATEVGNDVTSFSLAIVKTTLTDTSIGNFTDDELHLGVRDSLIRGVAAYNDFRHLVAEVKFRLNTENKTVGGCVTFKSYVEKYLKSEIESTETALRRAYRQIEDLDVKKEGAQHTGRPKSKALPKTNAHVVADGTVRDLEKKLEKAEAKIEKLSAIDDAFTYYVLRSEDSGEYVVDEGHIPNRKKLKYASMFFTEEAALKQQKENQSDGYMSDCAVLKVEVSAVLTEVSPAIGAAESFEEETDRLMLEAHGGLAVQS
jgi:hypothetical protein